MALNHVPNVSVLETQGLLVKVGSRCRLALEPAPDCGFGGRSHSSSGWNRPKHPSLRPTTRLCLSSNAVAQR